MVLVGEFYKTPTRFEVQKIAESVATSGVYGNPYLEPTGPSAHNAPGYPLILAGVYRLFGLGQAGEFASLVLNIVVWALVYALLPLASVELGLSVGAGVLAGTISALLPIHFRIELFNGEMPFTALFSLVLMLAFVRCWRQSELSNREGMMLGLLNGLTLLVSPNLATFAAALLVVTMVLNRRAPRRVLLFSLVFVGCSVLVLAPWAVRNHRALGRPILLRSNLGLELQISNNEIAKVTKVDNQSLSMARYHPFLNSDQARRVREVGEVAYNKEKKAAALAWMREHPGDLIHHSFCRSPTTPHVSSSAGRTSCKSNCLNVSLRLTNRQEN